MLLYFFSVCAVYHNFLNFKYRVGSFIFILTIDLLNAEYTASEILLFLLTLSLLFPTFFSINGVYSFDPRVYPIRGIALDNIALEYLFEGCTPQTSSDVYIQQRDFSVERRKSSDTDCVIIQTSVFDRCLYDRRFDAPREEKRQVRGMEENFGNENRKVSPFFSLNT